MYHLRRPCVGGVRVLRHVARSSCSQPENMGNTPSSPNIAQSRHASTASQGQGRDPVPSPPEKTPPNQKDPWVLRRKYITTSVNRIDVRPQGVTFDVGYVDTGADWHYSKKQTAPTILALHGLPSTHRDVLPMVLPLHDLGCRVIAVNLPGYEYSTAVSPDDERFFKQSTIEHTEFLFNFLQNLKVKKLDILLAHSAGSLPATIMASVSDITKSFITLCPLPGHTFSRGQLILNLVRGVANASDRPVLKKLVRPLLPAMNRTVSKFSSNDPDHLASVYKYLGNQNFDLLDSMAMDLEMKKIPFCYMYTLNDFLMGRHLSLEWAMKYGLREEDFEEYDSDFKLVKEAQPSEGVYRKGIRLAKGGHYPQMKTDTALPIIVKELKHILKLVTTQSEP